MIYGYARVSTAGQSINGNSLEDQTKALVAYGCQEIVTEAFTGKTMRLIRVAKNLSEAPDTSIPRCPLWTFFGLPCRLTKHNILWGYGSFRGPILLTLMTKTYTKDPPTTALSIPCKNAMLKEKFRRSI